ncbi:MAG: transglycosylase domain-containing protein, partial [Gemmatimonadota bacterium]
MNLRKRWNGWGRGKRTLFSLSLVAGALLLASVILLTTTISGDDGCPSVADLRTYVPPEATRVFAVDGSVVADLSPQRRVVTDIEDFPPILKEGMVAVEDRRFWDHGGVDLRSFGRAFWRNARSLSIQEGFSTITMQLARSVFPDQLPMREKLGRKVCEVYLAHRIEAEFQKREILQRYLNQIYFGAGLYGAQAAAEGYFGKPAAQLEPAEAALLVALVRSPEGYNPRKNPDRALERRNL